MRNFIRVALLVLTPLLACTAYAKNDHDDSTHYSTEQVQSLIDQHFKIWNDTDSHQRSKAFATVYTPDVFVADPETKAVGYAPIDQLISKLQQEHGGFVFSPQPVEWNHGLGRVQWGFGPKEAPDRVRGEDIFTIQDGRLSSLRVFLNSN